MSWNSLVYVSDIRFSCCWQHKNNTYVELQSQTEPNQNTVENLNVFSFNINRVSSVERARNAYTVHSTYACTMYNVQFVCRIE